MKQKKKNKHLFLCLYTFYTKLILALLREYLKTMLCALWHSKKSYTYLSIYFACRTFGQDCIQRLTRDKPMKRLESRVCLFDIRPYIMNTWTSVNTTFNDKLKSSNQVRNTTVTVFPSHVICFRHFC